MRANCLSKAFVVEWTASEWLRWITNRYKCLCDLLALNDYVLDVTLALYYYCGFFLLRFRTSFSLCRESLFSCLGIHMELARLCFLLVSMWLLLPVRMKNNIIIFSIRDIHRQRRKTIGSSTCNSHNVRTSLNRWMKISTGRHYTLYLHHNLHSNWTVNYWYVRLKKGRTLKQYPFAAVGIS